ncbi:2-aminoethanethiol dioxygenase [Phtheirospermum japonicum]|uniref:cysteine dioxygenase n=1 Tax=Phtheirospermum japonicum TaxID=374723 RepID=A0A830AX97_9LAMI|nr:2-aminoethanethiol dioxygenase [Phtheirospermum japonicum]
MGIEQNRGGGKHKVSNESKKNKRRQRKTSQVQRLYEACKEVFADCGPGIVPSPEKVEKLAAVLDGMTQADVGLRPDMPFFESERAPVITYLQLHECRPDGVRLAKIKVDSEFTSDCKTSILYPTDGGNMHRFTAKTACAVLDVLGPPYCDPEGRHCQYYYEFPYASFPVGNASVSEEEREGYVWLKKREKPKDLSVVGVPYNGPKIAKK